MVASNTPKDNICDKSEKIIKGLNEFISAIEMLISAVRQSSDDDAIDLRVLYLAKMVNVMSQALDEVACGMITAKEIVGEEKVRPTTAVISFKAKEAMDDLDVFIGLMARYIQGDWGDVSDAVKVSNDLAADVKGVIRAQYTLDNGTTIHLKTVEGHLMTFVYTDGETPPDER